MGGAIHFTKVLWVLIPVTAAATSTATIEATKGETSSVNGRKVNEVLTAENLKNSKNLDGIEKILKEVMEKKGQGKAHIKVKKVTLDEKNTLNEQNEENSWYKNILKKIVEEGYKWETDDANIEKNGKYYKKKVKIEKKQLFQQNDNETLKLNLEQWLEEKWEIVVKKVIKNCGFYKVGDNWSAGLNGVYENGFNWQTTKSSNEEKNKEEKIDKWFKNKCGLKIGDGPISWNSWNGGGSGPTDKTQNQGLTKDGIQWDNQIQSFFKKEKEKIKKQFKESRGVEQFISRLLTSELEQDLFEKNNNMMKIGKEWIDSGNGTLISWQT